MSTPSKKLIILSAPSGCGKTSLIKGLQSIRDDIAMTVSHTTRAMRPGEAHGIDYQFIDKAQFDEMVEQGAFIEHATVFDNGYGTSKQTVDDLLKSGKHVILDIDWQGARQVREKMPNAISIFVIPPTLDALRERLTARGQDSDDIINRRMAQAQQEMDHKDEYQHIIINDDFETALTELNTIISA